jgi:hypothetical protein
MTVIAMSRTEIDRMSVLRDLAASRIKVTEAAALMGLGRRQVFRLAKAYGRHGPQALVSRRRGRPSNRCYPTALHAEVIGMLRERYSDFGPTLAAEKLAELHGIDLARETVRQWMIAAGLWKDRHARMRPVHQPRYRRDCVGELVQRGFAIPFTNRELASLLAPLAAQGFSELPENAAYNPFDLAIYGAKLAGFEAQASDFVSGKTDEMEAFAFTSLKQALLDEGVFAICQKARDYCKQQDDAPDAPSFH